MSPFHKLVSLFSVSLFAWFAAFSVANVQGEQPLTIDAAHVCKIVRPANASPSQEYAAEELRRFTKEMTGVELPIITDAEPLPAQAILLGKTRHTASVLKENADWEKLGDDGFRLVTRGPHLLILGSPVRGTLYGVYELLEKYGGCRWYAKHRSVIPRHDPWTIPSVDETQLPAFAMREPFWWGMFDGDFAARSKVNGNRPNLEAKHGGKIRFGSGLFVHSFYPLMPPSEFFAEHPEYYSLIDGRRTTERAQLCLTNPDVVRIVTERVLDRIRKDPTAKLFSVSQNDWHGWCQCPNCRAIDEREGSPSGTMIHFVNQVAEAVEKEFPDVWIETLAYQYTRHPPKTIKPRRNVVPRLCTIECDFSKPLDVSPYEQNRKFVEDMRGWSAITDKLYVWDYTTNFGHYVSPHPNFGCLQGNVKFFRDNHVVGLFEQGAYQAPHAEFAELRAWILAKLLWNPDQEIEPLYDDFFQGYYGPAAEPIRKYFDELQSLVQSDDQTLRIWYPPTASYYTDEFFERAAALWEEAETRVKDDPELLYNVRMSALPVMYARLERWPKVNIQFQWRDGTMRPVGVDPEYAALAREFLDRLEEGKVSRISENQARHAQYLSKLRGRVGGYQPCSIKNQQLAAVVIPELGARVLYLAKENGANLLQPDAGGVDFIDATGSLLAVDLSPYRAIHRETSSAAFQRDVRGRYRVDRNVKADGGGLAFTCTFTSGRSEPQTVHPTLSIALALGPAPLLRGDDGKTWTSLAVPANQTWASRSIVGSDLASRSLVFASQDGKRGVQVALPDADIERIWMLSDAKQLSTRVFVLFPERELAPRSSQSFGLTLLPSDPLPRGTLPEVPAAREHRVERLQIDDCLMSLGHPGEWGALVRDPLADDGFAVKLFNTHYEWCLQWRVDPTQFESGAKYRLRMRIRVEKTDRQGTAFWAGVYDVRRKKGWGQVQPTTDAVKDGYQWYDVATWKPETDQYIWVGPGVFDKEKGQSAIQAVYVDQFELTRVE